MSAYRSRATAIHEAGHALAYWWNGQFIYTVAVRSSDDKRAGPYITRKGLECYLSGVVEGVDFIPCPQLLKLSLDAGGPKLDGLSGPAAEGLRAYYGRLPELAAADLLHAYCGPVAHAIHNKQSLTHVLWAGGWSDYQHICALLGLLPEDQREEADRQAIARCRALVRRYWPAVCALADLLQERGTVDGEEVIDLLCAVTGETPNNGPYARHAAQQEA